MILETKIMVHECSFKINRRFEKQSENNPSRHMTKGK
jgi:hypothetical protein